MVKRVNLVDIEALVAGKVLDTIRVAGLDEMEFEGWLIERYGSNEKVRKAIEEAVKGVEDKEATLYVPEHNPVRMVWLPKANVIKFLDMAFRQVLTEMCNANFSFDKRNYDYWADEVDDSISNLLEALFYYMVKNSNAYKTEKGHICWKYLLEVARMQFEGPCWSEGNYKAFTLDAVLIYVLAGPEHVKKALITEYENFDSSAYRLAVRIGSRFHESSITDPESFYKDEKGWNILFGSRIRKKWSVKSQDITFKFTTNDNRNNVEMMAMFDNEKSKNLNEILAIIVGRLAEARLIEKYGTFKVAPDNTEIPTVVFTINHKGMTDYDFLDDIEDVVRICAESAIEIAS